MAYGFGAPDSGDPSQDPLFYRGRTPVLGQDVEVRTSGALPLDFPQAGRGPAAPAGPSRPGSTFPSFPSFEFPEFSFDFSGQPTAPTRPTGADAPFAGSPQWWQLALGGLEAGQKGWGALQALRDITQPQDLPDFPGIEPSGMPETAADLAAKGGVFSEGAPSGLAGGSQASIGNLGAEGAGAGTNWAALAGPALQTAGGAATLAMGGDTRSRVLGGAQTAAGVSGLLATSGAAPALAGLSPALTIATLPLIVGAIYEQFNKKDLPVWPEGYWGIPGQDRAAVDPSTGRVLWYGGHGHYEWSPQTQANQKATPEDLAAWGIIPSGALLQDPAYRAILPQLYAQGRFATADPSQLDPALLQLPEVQDYLRSNALQQSGGTPQAIPDQPGSFLQYASGQPIPDPQSLSYSPGGVG